MSTRTTFATVHEAAEILGVAPNTIRAWGAQGKLPEYRHPMNGYRLYKKVDLTAVLKRLEASIVEPLRMKRRRRAK